MGEAKRRREADPFFGKLPKAGKGIVVSSPTTIEEDGSLSLKGGIDPIELRRSVLFWDHIVKPINRIIYMEPSADEQFLKECGIFKEVSCEEQNYAGMAGHLLAEMHLSVFSQLEKKDPGLWTLSEGERSFNLKARGAFKEGRGAVMELYRAIPLPTSEVPLYDLLDFKAKRRDELLSLRLELDGLFLRLSNAIDMDRELRACIAEVDKRCADVIKASRDSRLSFSQSEITYGISLEGSFAHPLLAAFGGYVVGQSFELPTIGALAGAATGVASMIKFKFGIGGKLQRSKESEKLALSPYRMVSRMINEPI